MNTNNEFKPRFNLIFKTVVDLYKTKFNIDLSYMKFKLSIQPEYTNGEPCNEFPPNEAAGDWTNLGYVRLNPDMISVMDFWKFEHNTYEQVLIFIVQKIAHELAHEIYNNSIHTEFKNNMLNELSKTNFNDTPYLKIVTDDKYEQEQFCEYLGCEIETEFKKHIETNCK